MARRRRGRSSGRRAKREGQWGGIQFPLTNIPVAGSFQDLANNLSTEERDRTCVGVRGFMTFSNSGSDSVNGVVGYACKLLTANVNDAFAITDDVQAIDTSLEDIQQRQLWTCADTLIAASNVTSHQFQQYEIEVRVKIKLPARSKQVYGMLIDATVVNRLQVTGYLRAYYVF